MTGIKWNKKTTAITVRTLGHSSVTREARPRAWELTDFPTPVVYKNNHFGKWPYGLVRESLGGSTCQHAMIFNLRN